MTDFDKWPEQFRQLVDVFEQVFYNQTEDSCAALIDETTQALQDLECQIPSFTMIELEDELNELLADYAQWQSKLAAAQALGLAEIQAQISTLTSEQMALDMQNLPQIQAVIADFRDKGITAVAHQQAIAQTINQHHQRLEALAQEKVELAQEETTLQQHLANWQQQAELRQLRQDCLQTAEALQNLRQTLQQQVQQAGT